MILEQPYPLRHACANCPEPVGGRGVLRQGVVACATCHTANFALPPDETALHPLTICPDCQAKLRIAPGGNCPHCGLTGRTMAAIEELRRLYTDAAADLTAQHRKAVELLLATAYRVPT
jgi:hypothetical protein